MTDRLKLYFDPMSRASMARWMLEEVGAPHEIVPVDIRSGASRTPEYLAINPMGKVPAMVLPDGTVVTETPAIIAWLADAYPEAGLAPAVGSPERGSYYRWLFFGNGCFEPAFTETMMRKDASPLPPSTVGWGSYESVVSTLENALSKSPYLCGDRFTAADLYVGSQLSWAKMFNAPLVTTSAVIGAYIKRIAEREGYKRAMTPAEAA